MSKLIDQGEVDEDIEVNEIEEEEEGEEGEEYDPLAAGYDPEEPSDVELPDDGLDYSMRADMNKWHVREGGDRLPKMWDKIPHRDSIEVEEADGGGIDDDMVSMLTDVAAIAKKMDMELLVVKEKYRLLARKIDLLKWHTANDAKDLGNRLSAVNAARTEVAKKEEKYAKLMTQQKQLTIVHDGLINSCQKKQNELDAVLEEYEEKKGRQEEMLEQQSNLKELIGIEARKAKHQRSLRNRQLKKLLTAVNRDTSRRFQSLRHLNSGMHMKLESANKILNHLKDV
eukprot:GHVH01010826.1.p1 GENE.GHVH01010826.1~~GHVH01010826.1.p1  ORF type:complete len:284 (+),score=63.58 GHVH01010826.1:102-953(+)